MQRTCTGSRFEIRFTLWLPEAMPIANVLIQSFEDFPPQKKAEGLESWNTTPLDRPDSLNICGFYLDI